MPDDQKSLAMRMVVMKYILDRIVPAQKSLRTNAEEMLAPKDRVAAVHPCTGVPLGTITKSSPGPSATVDEAVFADWMSEHYPERVLWQTSITDMDSALAVLRAHAPDLLEHHPVVAPYAVAEVKRLSEAAGQPVGPGGEVEVPGIVLSTKPGVVSVRVEAAAGDAIADLVTGGHVALDGRALPGGAS